MRFALMVTGDVAALLGLPLLLFDDRERNLDDIIKKGVAGCEGVLVRRGDASQREVRRDWRSRVINDPEDWIHQGLGFIKRRWSAGRRHGNWAQRH